VETLFNGTLALAGRDQETTGFAWCLRYLSIYISSTLQISLKLLSPLNFSIIIPFPIFLFPPNLFTEAKNTIPNPNPDHPSFLSGFKI
jgi:hypothetical protein